MYVQKISTAIFQRQATGTYNCLKYMYMYVHFRGLGHITYTLFPDGGSFNN